MQPHREFRHLQNVKKKKTVFVTWSCWCLWLNEYFPKMREQFIYNKSRYQTNINKEGQMRLCVIQLCYVQGACAMRAAL